MKRFCTNDCQSDKFDVYPEESLKLPSEKYLKRKLSYSTFRNHSGNNPGPKHSFYYVLHIYYITYVVRDVLGLLTQFYLIRYLDSLQCRLLDVVLRNQVHMHIFLKTINEVESWRSQHPSGPPVDGNSRLLIKCRNVFFWALTTEKQSEITCLS